MAVAIGFLEHIAFADIVVHAPVEIGLVAVQHMALDQQRPARQHEDQRKTRENQKFQPPAQVEESVEDAGGGGRRRKKDEESY